MSIVTYEKDGAVGVVTLAEPLHNLIDEAFLDALLAAYGSAVARAAGASCCAAACVTSALAPM